MSAKKQPEPDAQAPPVLAPGRMEELFDELVQGLPLLEQQRVAELVRALAEFPASGKRLVLRKFTRGAAAEQAVAYVVFAEFGRKAADELNALVFDSSQSDEVRVRANELLTELGSPIDRDVLEMSIERPDEVAGRSPWQAARDLEAGRLDEALARLKALEAKTRAVVMHRIARKDVARALPLLDRLAEADEESALAAAGALTECPAQESAALLLRLARCDWREVQKAARRALHSLRAAGFEVPEEAAEKPAVKPPEEAEAPGLPIFKAVVAELPGRRAAFVSVAREYPNGRLQVFSAALDFWKRGIRWARYRLDMSKSHFRRELDERAAAGLALRDAALEECRRMVARGLRVAREVGTPIPFDIQAGKHVLGDVMAEAEQLQAAFLCSGCGAPLEEEQVVRIKDAAAYDQLAVETRCLKCRAKE